MPLVRPTWCPIPALSGNMAPGDLIPRCKVPCMVTYFAIVQSPTSVEFTGDISYVASPFPFSVPTPIYDLNGKLLCTVNYSLTDSSIRQFNWLCWSTEPPVRDSNGNIEGFLGGTVVCTGPGGTGGLAYGPYAGFSFFGSATVTYSVTGGPSPPVQLNAAQLMVPIAAVPSFTGSTSVIPDSVPALGSVYNGYFTLPSPAWPGGLASV